MLRIKIPDGQETSYLKDCDPPSPIKTPEHIQDLLDSVSKMNYTTEQIVSAKETLINFQDVFSRN